VFPACPRDPGTPLPPREELAALARTLAAQEPNCAADGAYLAYYGAVLNALGRHAEAASKLEQALLFEPDLAGAQVDYAEALAAVGDLTAALALMRDVSTRPDVPPALRDHLVRRMNAIEALQRFDLMTGMRTLIGGDWRATATVTVQAGYDSNLNSAPSRETLPLTIPGADAVLLLADRFRARGGAVGLVEARGQLGRRLEAGSVLQMYGEARGRWSPSESDTDYQQGQAIVAWSRPVESGEVLFGAGVTYLHYGGDDLYSAYRLAASKDWQYQACQPRLGAEVESRHYPVAGELEGRFAGLLTGVTCRVGQNRLTAALRGGIDFAQRDRPGGDQRQADLRLVWIRPLGAGSFLADLGLSHQRDQSGYSPLLENNDARRVNRATVRFEYDYPISRDWSVVATFDGTLQRSNLPLFDVSGAAAYLGFRWHAAR
jgi:hypothetical protein